MKVSTSILATRWHHHLGSVLCPACTSVHNTHTQYFFLYPLPLLATVQSKNKSTSDRMVKSTVIVDGSDHFQKYLLEQLGEDFDAVSYTRTVQRRKINCRFCTMSAVSPPQSAPRYNSMYLHPFSLVLSCSTSNHFHNLSIVSKWRPWCLLGPSSHLAVRLQAELSWDQPCFCQLRP